MQTHNDGLHCIWLYTNICCQDNRCCIKCIKEGQNIFFNLDRTFSSSLSFIICFVNLNIHNFDDVYPCVFPQIRSPWRLMLGWTWSPALMAGSYWWSCRPPKRMQGSMNVLLQTPWPPCPAPAQYLLLVSPDTRFMPVCERQWSNMQYIL